MVLTISNLAARRVLPLLGLVFMACLTPGAGASASAQKYVPPPPALTTAPCVPTKKNPCPAPAAAPATTANPFPFPGDTPDGTTPAQATPQSFPYPGDTAPGQATTPDAGKQTPQQAARAHPFPGDNDSQPASSSSSSSSSNADTALPDDSGPALKDEGSSGSSRFKRHSKLPKVEDKSNRVDNDLDVARYYASTGDYNAAYLRAKDAVATLPDDPESHFTLAEMAEKLKKTDEAAEEFRAYLRLEPDGEHLKYAAHALERLGPK